MKDKRLLYVILLVLGVSLVIFGGFVSQRDLPKAVSGVLIGVGAGLFGLSIGELIARSVAERNPKLKRQVEIEVNDERTLQIQSLAKAKAFQVMEWIFPVAFLVLILSEVSLPFILLLIGMYLTIWVVYFMSLLKYSREL